MNEAMNEKEPSIELRLQDLLMAYLHKWKIIVLCMVVCGILAWGFTYFCITPMYRTGIKIYVSNYVSNEDVIIENDRLTSADVSASIYLVKSYLIAAETDAVLDKAVDKLEGDYTAAQLRSAISVEQVENTVIFNLYVTHSDPLEAVRIANVLAEVIPEEGPKVMKGTSAAAIDTAKPIYKPYSPNFSNNVILGLAGGLLLALVYVTILFLKDTHIKDENDLTDMFNLPILGRIPDFNDEITGNQYVLKSEGGKHNV